MAPTWGGERIPVRFRWDVENVEHVGRHGIGPRIANDVLRGGAFVVVSDANAPTGSGRKTMMGPTSHGKLLTIIIEPTEHPDVWRPVTAWWSTDREIDTWTRAR